MSRLSRWLFLQLGREVTREQARDLAQAACEARSLPWQEPVKVYRHYGDWAAWTFANHRGGNVRVIIDGGSGAVKRVAGPTPR
jgi:hypothetical protein